MAISSNFPNVRPSLLLDFANSQQLDPRVTFSRSTTAQYYDGKTSALAEQNLLLNSQTFPASAPWQYSNVTVTNNSITAPDGTTTGSTLTGSSTNSGLLAIFTATTNQTFTYSIYVQAGNISSFDIYGVDQTVATFNVRFTLSGAGSSSLISGTASSSITQIGSSAWYRCTITRTFGANNSSEYFQIFTGNQGATVAGNYIYIWGAQLEQRSSVTAYNPTTTSAITNYIPQLLTAPINSPRFDFNPVTGESLGLLIEQSSTNLLTYSQDFSNAVWTKTNTTVTTGADIAPDGTQTMNLLQETTATGQHYAITGTILTSGTQYTVTIYAKAYGQSTLGICYGYDSGGANFNLSTGAVGTVDAGVTASITAVGNGVYRCQITRTPASNSALIFQLNGKATSYTGNGYSGIYIWGAQLEALAFPTSYIATTSAQVTRASDNASMTGTNFSSWFNQGQGTFYGEMDLNNFANAQALIGVNQNDIYGAGKGMLLRVRSNNLIDFGGNGTSANATGVTLTNNSIIKLAGSYNVSTLFQGVNYSSSTYVSNNTLDYNGQGNQLRFGGITSSVNLIGSGHIRKFAYYPIQITSTQLQALTGS